MTIRLRLTLWYTTLLGATLILFSVIVYASLYTTLRAAVEQNAERQAVNVASVIAKQLVWDPLIIRSDPSAIVLPDIGLFGNPVGVQITGLDGSILKRSFNLGEVVLPEYEQALPDIELGNDHKYYTPPSRGFSFLVYSTPLVVNDTILGAVQIIQPVQTSITALSQVSRYLILGTVISLILAAIVGAFLARRALEPIDTITSTAGAITRTRDLGKRIQIADNASEIGRLAATFNDMLDRIQQLFQTQERLIGDVSHELRTPLTTVQGNIDLLQRMAGSSATPTPERAMAINALLNETLVEVQAETERMSEMISDLLLLAQADSGALQLQWGPVELDTLLLDVYRQTRRLADHYKGPGELEVRLGSEDQAIVQGDRDKLRQVLLNLAENAVKYTPSGGVVTMGLQHDGDGVEVYVQDTGIGISDEQQQQIFERFFRTDKARSRELGGSGLGLSIAQSIAQAHGGNITVSSKLGVGSTFTLWLPATAEPLGEYAAPVGMTV
jgi:two-component system OmpR family sensor kinase